MTVHGSSLRAWGREHPAGMAAWQGLTFGILFGLISSLSSRHSVAWDALDAAITAVLFGLLMYAYGGVQRRRRR